MRPTRFPFALRFLLSAVSGLLAVGALALPITYQGRLTDGPVAANGEYELTFSVFAQPEAGTALRPAVVLPKVGVTNGLFSVQLEFGDGVFDGAARWIELAARVTGSAEAPETLAPRQPVNAVPYALRALSGSGNAAELTSGFVPDARLSANIVRAAGLLSVSNAFAVRSEGLAEQVAQLSAAVLALSSQLSLALPPGLTVASVDPADPALTARGLERFLSFEAGGWQNGAVAPAARSAHSSVWTGDSLLIWGGLMSGGETTGTGARYRPESDQWTVLPPMNAPSPRRGHSTVWTGQAMLLWGGFGSGFLGDGAAYSPGGNSWTPLGAVNAPEAREGHVAIWTGARMVIWGGRHGGGPLSDGAIYDPATRQWTSLPDSGSPAARFGATANWTGAHLLLWGGQGEQRELNSGALLPLDGGVQTGAWIPTSLVRAPSARTGHTAVWTGTRLLVWGGRSSGLPLGTGAAFDPVNNVWEPLPTAGAPTARFGHVAVWTGEEMLVFGGEDTGGALTDGAAYLPGKGRWRPLPAGGSPLARSQASGVWSGKELIVFGGTSSGAPLAALQRLNPQPAWHFFRKP